MVIIPTTPEDFKAIDKKIGKNEDKFCPYCNEPLVSTKHTSHMSVIIYRCIGCDIKYKKTYYFDKANNENYFKLKKWER